MVGAPPHSHEQPSWRVTGPARAGTTAGEGMPTLSRRLFTCCPASRGCRLGSRAQRCRLPAQPPGHRAGHHAEHLRGRPLSVSGLRALMVGLFGSRAGRKGMVGQGRLGRRAEAPFTDAGQGAHTQPPPTSTGDRAGSPVPRPRSQDAAGDTCRPRCRLPRPVCLLRGHGGSLHLDLPMAAAAVPGLLHASHSR